MVGLWMLILDWLAWVLQIQFKPQYFHSGISLALPLTVAGRATRENESAASASLPGSGSFGEESAESLLPGFGDRAPGSETSETQSWVFLGSFQRRVESACAL